MPLSAQFLSSFLHRGIEVAFAFEVDKISGSTSKCALFFEKCPFFSYLGCLKGVINSYFQDWKLLCKILETG